MDVDVNPYASPASVADTSTTSSDFGEIFFGWERLRVIFNSVLVSLTLLCGFPSFADPRFWSTAMLGAFVTNVCFCVGPVLEGYATWMFRRQVRWLRWGLFLLGQLFAAGLACTVILNAFPANWKFFGF